MAESLLEVKRKSKYTQRLGRLKVERESYVSHWKDLTDNLLPRSGRYFLEDRNKGERRNLAIYDSTGTRALGVLAAGMMAGMSSPARKWFTLALADRDLMEFQPVKLWLDDVVEIIREIFARSNCMKRWPPSGLGVPCCLLTGKTWLDCIPKQLVSIT